MKKTILSILMLVGVLPILAQVHDVMPKRAKELRVKTMPSTVEESPFLWTKGNTSIRLGGFVRVATSVDFDGAIDNNDFIPSKISVPNSWETRNRYGLEASASRLSLAFTQKTSSLGDIKIYFESDFRGDGDVLRLRQAYVSLVGFTFGQTWSYLVDMAANAPTIDVQGVNSRTFFRTPLIGYVGKLGKKWDLGVAVEFPKMNATLSSGYKKISQRFPDVPIFAQYKAEGGHVRLSGVLRCMECGLPAQEQIESRFGWGVQFSGSLRPVDGLTLYAQGIYGRGISRYINDLSSLGLDVMPVNSSGLGVIPMYGGSFGARLDFSKKIYAASSFSMVGVDYHGDNATIYKRGSYLSGTLFWNAYKNLTLAVEYLHGSRKNFNDHSGSANRVQLMVKYDF